MNQQKKKPPVKITNLLFYGDYNCDTGFGHVSKELINEWSKDLTLNITVFAINDFSEKPYKVGDNLMVIPALGVSEQKQDVYCRLELLQCIMRNDFDIIFFLNDVEVFNKFGEHLRNVKNEKKKLNRKSFKSILYFPIDSVPRKSELEVLSVFDEIITYTDYAKDAIRPLISTALHKKLRVIPHGCNTKDFHPFDAENKRSAKKELFGRDDVFVFGSINRNSIRKDLGTLLLGFANFKHTRNPDALLYLHCNPTDQSGINIPVLCERLDLTLGVDVIVPKDHNENKGYTPEHLNRVYNALDCFITTTTAEGWGLTIAEAMATKTIVVCPKHTAIQAVTADGEHCMNFTMQEPAVFVNDNEKIRFRTPVHEVAHVFNVVYNAQSESEDIHLMYETKKQRAYEHVRSMRWDIIATRFRVIIDRYRK